MPAFAFAGPVILYTDILSGPNSGGENNKGIYLSIFGKDFGSSGLGTTVKVYINDVEVDNYRSLVPSRGRQDIQQITVQIGAIGNPTPGVALPIKVVVNGVASNIDKTFTVNPGTIYFVSLSGDDSTGMPGDIARPYRTVQKPGINNNGLPGCPIASGDQPVATAGVWGLVHPGDFIVMRAGTWTDVGRDGFFLRVQNKSGTAPTGAVGTGPITIMGYPGENVFINRTNLLDNQGGGGISSADSARQALGCGARVTLANLIVESGFNDGMISTQRGVDNPNGSYWRVVNNEMTAVSGQNNTKCKGAGVSGSGLGQFWVGNYIHDVYDKPDGTTNNENHGFYVDGSGSYEIAYNRIKNIYGGNGIQAYSSSSTPINNVNIYHNVINGTSKHGLNIGDYSGTGFVIYNNLVYNTDVAGLRFNTTSLSGAKIYNNTFFKTDRLNVGGIRAALMNDWSLGPGALDMRNNIIIPGSTSHEYIGGSVDFGGVIGTFSNNLWFNGAGGTIVGSGDKNGDPKFVSIVSGTEDFHLQAGGAAQDVGTAVVASLVTDDYDTTPRPQGGLYDIGAFEFYDAGGIPDTTAPAAVNNLAASTGINPGEINLSWTAPGDDGTTGTAAAYIIKYASSAITTEAQFSAAADVTGEPLPLAAGTNQSMTATGLTAGQIYYFVVKTQDEVPNISGLSNSPSAVSQYGNAAPVLALIGNKTVVEGSSLSFTITATDAEGDLLTYSASNLPTGAAFDPVTKTFSWIPTPIQVGSYNVSFAVNDGNGGSDSETITITVTDKTTVTESVSIIRQDCTGYSNCYTSLAAWEAAQNRDLVASNEIAVARVEGPWTNPDTTPVVIDGWTTGPNNYIKIYTTPEARHSGKWDTGKYRLQNSIGNLEDYVRIDGLQIGFAMTSNYSGISVSATNGSSDVRISNSIIRATSISGTYIRGIRLNTGTVKIWNNIVYDFIGDSTYQGIATGGSTVTGYLYNNTVFNCYDGIRNDNSSVDTLYIVNNIVQQSTGGYFSGGNSWGAGSDYNISNVANDLPAGQTNSKNSTTVSFVDSTNSDFHLASNDTGAKDAGTDLSADANLSFTTDIDSQTRSGIWDIGADETVVNSNTAPVLALIGSKTVTEGSSLSFAISATDADGDLLTYSASNLPLGASFDPATKTFSWTPGYTQAGSYNINFSVSDGKGGVSSETITITVTDVTQAVSVMVMMGNSSGHPGDLNKEVLVSVGDVTGLGVISMDLALDYNAAELTFVSGSTAGTIASNWPAPAYNSSTPGKLLIAIYGTTPLLGQGDLLKLYFNVNTTASVGTSNLILSKAKINDGIGIISTLQNGTFTVLANQAPILAPVGDKTVNEGELLNIVLTATDADNYPLPLVYSASGLPTGAAFDPVTKTFSWIPTYTQAGSYPAVHFEATDGVLVDSEDITITVVNSNIAPVLALIGNKTVTEGASLSFGISATDADGDLLTYSASNLPLGASFDPATKTFSWIPDYTQAGSYNVDFSVSDGKGGSDSKTSAITVTNTNRAPVLDAIGAKTITLGSTLTFIITAADLDQDVLTYSASGLPQGASFDIVTKTFSWTPGSGKAGSYTVTFTVTDSYGDFDNESIIITVSMAYGDVNGDTEVSAYDAALAAQYAVGLITLTQEQIKAANVTIDTEVSAYDAALIAQKAVGLISKFPREQ